MIRGIEFLDPASLNKPMSVGFVLFEEDFDIETHERNFHFMNNVQFMNHLFSFHLHSAKIGDKDKSYEMYLQYQGWILMIFNNDYQDGLHITSMWHLVVRWWKDLENEDSGRLSCFKLFLPKHFTAIVFKE